MCFIVFFVFWHCSYSLSVIVICESVVLQARHVSAFKVNHSSTDCLCSLPPDVFLGVCVCYVQLWKHLIVRILMLIVIPLSVYISVFYVHLRLLTKTGPHDDLMTSAFQASLQVSVSPVYRYPSHLFTGIRLTCLTCLQVSISPVYRYPSHLFTGICLTCLTLYRANMYANLVVGVVILSVCLSVRPSVTRMHCDKTKWCTEDIFIPLLLRHQQWLVGSAPFHLKFAFKVTHPLWKMPTSTGFRL